MAGALQADFTVFLTDVPGVRDGSGAVLSRLSRARLGALIDDGTVHGGMLPKVKACLAALASGAQAACICDGRDPGALLPLLDGNQPLGTLVTALDSGAQ